MTLRSRHLAMRREKLIAAIASQRVRLETDIQPVRTALHVLDRVHDATGYLLRRLPIVSIGLGVIFLVMRGSPTAFVLRSAKLGLKVSRWWGRWKMLRA